MTNEVLTEQHLKNEFLMVCETSLKNAQLAFPSIDSENFDSTESLARIAKACFNAFSKAYEDYKDNNKLPLINGTDPYNHESPLTALDEAFSNVNGFTISSTLKDTNPDSIAALEALQPIANIICDRGYCIFT